MATEALSSTIVTNLIATPRVPNSSFTDKGILRTSRGSVTITTGKTVGSTYDMVRVPSNCRVTAVKLTNAAGSASSAFDIGVYKVGSDNALGAVADADLFASAQACTNANVDLDVTGESTVYTNAKRDQALWEAAGITTDPGGELAIGMVNTATNAAGFSAALEVEWTI